MNTDDTDASPLFISATELHEGFQNDATLSDAVKARVSDLIAKNQQPKHTTYRTPHADFNVIQYNNVTFFRQLKDTVGLGPLLKVLYRKRKQLEQPATNTVATNTEDQTNTDASELDSSRGFPSDLLEEEIDESAEQIRQMREDLKVVQTVIKTAEEQVSKLSSDVPTDDSRAPKVQELLSGQKENACRLKEIEKELFEMIDGQKEKGVRLLEMKHLEHEHLFGTSQSVPEPKLEKEDYERIDEKVNEFRELITAQAKHTFWIDYNFRLLQHHKIKVDYYAARRAAWNQLRDAHTERIRSFVNGIVNNSGSSAPSGSETASDAASETASEVASDTMVCVTRPRCEEQCWIQHPPSDHQLVSAVHEAFVGAIIDGMSPPSSPMSSRGKQVKRKRDENEQKQNTEKRTEEHSVQNTEWQIGNNSEVKPKTPRGRKPKRATLPPYLGNYDPNAHAPNEERKDRLVADETIEEMLEDQKTRKGPVFNYEANRNKSRRQCGTPGCVLTEGHLGPHSTEFASGRRSSDKLKKYRFPGVFNENLLRKQISVYWPKQKRWYKGRIVNYNKVNELHTINYSDGDVRDENMADPTVMWSFV